MWEVFLDAIFALINWLYGFTHDWGMAIILITRVFRIIIYPITRKQYKSTYAMQKMQPQLKAIREKYADDQQRQQEETMKLYQEAKFNPLSGCLPMVLQMPIFIALYQVLLNLSGHIEKVTGSLPENVSATFYQIIPDLTLSPSTVFFSQGVLAVIPYIILVLLFGVSILVPMFLNKSADKQTKIMSIVMAAVMLWFGWTVPAGVLLYWDVSSIIGIGQQTMSQRLLKKKDELKEADEIKPIMVDVERKEHKSRPTKKNR